MQMKEDLRALLLVSVVSAGLGLVLAVQNIPCEGGSRFRTMRSINVARNPYIEACRFIAAVVIMFHHSGSIGERSVAQGGWIFVEYFFMLSGYFLTRHCDSLREGGDIERSAWAYVWKVYKKMLPFAAAGICIDVFAQTLQKGTGWDAIGEFIPNLPLSLLMLDGFGLSEYRLDDPLWFVSALLLATPFLYVFMRRRPQLYRYLFSWSMPILIYATIQAVHGRIQYWGEGWHINCILRAFAGLMIGSVLFFLSEETAVKCLVRRYSLYLTILELFAFACCVAGAFIGDCISSTYANLFLLAFSLLITFSKEWKTGSAHQRGGHAACCFLGKMSVAMYCLHKPLFNLISYCTAGTENREKVIICVASVICVSFLAILLQEKLAQRSRS